MSLHHHGTPNAAPTVHHHVHPEQQQQQQQVTRTRDDSGIDILPPKIIIAQQPARFVFSEEWFPIYLDVSSICPRGSGGGMEPTSNEMELCCNLHRYANGSIIPDPIMQDNNHFIQFHLLAQQPNENRRDQRTKPGTPNLTIAKCRIKSSPLLAQDRKPIQYCICFYYRSTQTGDVIKDVEKVYTIPVQIVKYKLVIHHEWTNDVFYKDEGGKEKCLRARVNLVDDKNLIVRGLHLPLKLRLVYDDEENNIVLRQSETLRVLGSSKHFVDPENGEAVIKFRIEDVSKNHQGLKFKLEVSPSDVRKSCDIAPVISPGITVRSKRNKRQTSPIRRKLNHIDEPLSFDEAFHQFHDPSSPHDSSTKSPDRRSFDVRAAMNGVMSWSKEVAKILPSLKWNLIGYCQNADGSADYSKPNHIMPYPNECISRILSDFNHETSYCLHVLKEAVDHGIIRDGMNDIDKSKQLRMSGEEGGITRGRDNKTMPIPSIPNLPGQLYFSSNTSADFDICPQSPFNVTPVTPQGLGHTHPSVESQRNLDESRKRQRLESDAALWSPFRQEPNYHMRQKQDEHFLLSDVEYILAKHFRNYGFPVYSAQMNLIGFYRESPHEIGIGQFSPVFEHCDLNSNDIAETVQNLKDAVAQKSKAVHCKKDWGSITSMFDHAMVYDWSKDFGHGVEQEKEENHHDF